MPKVSIIVPVYNVEPYLDSCIQSLINQTLTDIEIILVDDQSPDNCPALCDEYAQQDKRIHVIHKQNGGLGYARNSGMAAATGEYIAFCDSDDFMDLNAYEVCYNAAKQTNADEVRFLMRRFSNGDNIIYKNSPTNARLAKTSNATEKLDTLLTNIAPLLHSQTLKVQSTASSCTAIFKTSVIREHNIQFLSERKVICEDYLFNIDFANACDTIVFTENTFYNYRHNWQSLSMSFYPERLNRNLSFINILANKLKSIGYPEAETFAVGGIFSILFAFIKQIFSINATVAEKKNYFKTYIDFKAIKSLTSKYPFTTISFATRVRFKIVMSQNFWLCYAFEVVKNLLLKFRKE